VRLAYALIVKDVGAIENIEDEAAIANAKY
jgi:hypothetical protein